MAQWKPNMLYHGADYNPDQWLDYPEILKQDIEYMKKAGFNCVSLGIFAWAHLEPSEGHYDFKWMHKIIDDLYSNGIYTILATPSGAKPVWMSEKYEQIRRVNKSGQRELTGSRHNHCYTSPVYRKKTAQMNTRLAKEFGGNQGVILWHLSNEYGGECYCPLCAAAFRKWLKDKYGTLEKLNHEWWTHFWSHTYTDWDQINPPMNHGEQSVHGLNLDWKRFVTYQTVDFMKSEIEALRKGGSKQPVTTNLMGFYDVLDYNKFAPHLDVVSWDSYPLWHNDSPDEMSVPVNTAISHDLMRCIKREPFLLMESTPSVTNWSEVSKLKRPGMHMLSSMQAIAHGADSVQYFQWRKSRGSCEKLHGAVVDHDCRDDHRVFLDVAGVGARLQKLGELAGTSIEPEVAILFDWENRWAIEDARGPRNLGKNYEKAVFEHYRAFWEKGVNADIIDMEKDLSRYKLVIAPMLYMYRAGVADKLRSFVQNGGTLVGTYWSGVVNENDLCFIGGRPGEGMAEVYGLYADEIDALYNSNFNSFNYQGVDYRLTELCELIRAENAEVLAVYSDDFYAGKPVLTRNRWGQGTAYYLAARPEQSFLRMFYSQLADELELRPDIIKPIPYGMSLCKRQGSEGKIYWIFQNYLPSEISAPLNKPLKNIESGDTVNDIALGGYGVAVLSEEI